MVGDDANRKELLSGQRMTGRAQRVLVKGPARLGRMKENRIADTSATDRLGRPRNVCRKVWRYVGGGLRPSGARCPGPESTP